jgi:small redox-active disulfide protein 2
MKIEILGSGCKKCRNLAQNAETAVAQRGVDATVEKVTDSDKIMEMGVAVTPALAIDGEVKSSGKLLTVEQIEELLR